MAGFKLEGGKRDGVCKRIVLAAVAAKVGEASTEKREPNNKNHEQYFNVLRSLGLGDWAEALSDDAVPVPVWGRLDGPSVAGLTGIMAAAETEVLAQVGKWIGDTIAERSKPAPKPEADPAPGGKRNKPQ